MDILGIWLSPLLLLPGTGLLIMSTSQRFNRLHDEIHHVLEDSVKFSHHMIDHLFTRAHLFRNSLVLLYLAVSIFAFAGLLGGITSGWNELSMYITIGLTIIGILCLATASILLIRESYLSLEVMKYHIKNFEQDNK